MHSQEPQEKDPGVQMLARLSIVITTRYYR